MRLTATIACLLLSSSCVVFGPPLDSPPPQRPPDTIASPAELHADIRFLSDDALEGRGPGTRGDALTQLWLETTFQQIGLVPALPDGSWRQPFELLGITSHVPVRWEFRVGKKRFVLRNSEDYVAVSQKNAPQVCVRDAELVFVGFGIQAPEYDWDDFKGADLRGKILLFLNNDPDWDPALFAGKRRLYYGRWTYKYESAARQHAAGAIVLHTDESASYPWQTVQTSWGGENSRLPDGKDDVSLRAWITEEAVRRLLTEAGLSLDDLTRAARERTFRPVPIGARTSLCVKNSIRRYQTANVVGVLPGRDESVRNEMVVYSAHHDHLGRAPASGDDHRADDRIYNGAVDNAAGVAQMMAVARVFARTDPLPRRSILFLAAAAEEQGLLGSEYFAAHLPVPPERIVANLNLDGGNVLGRTSDVSFIGYGKSTLDRFAERAAAAQGRTITEEPFPERGSFYRSDQFNFARIGVPALFLKPGTEVIGKPPGWGREREQAWIKEHYHQPSDEYVESWDLTGMSEDAALAYEIGRLVADAGVAPAWNAGDEFEALRKPSSPTPTAAQKPFAPSPP